MNGRYCWRRHARSPSKNLVILMETVFIEKNRLRMVSICCTSSLTSGAASRNICASLAITANRALLVFTGRVSVAKVPLGAVEALCGTRVVHVLP